MPLILELLELVKGVNLQIQNCRISMTQDRQDSQEESQGEPIIEDVAGARGLKPTNDL